VRAFPSDDGVIVLVRDVTEARAITERLSEALLRWNHPQLGLLTPADFLDVLLESSAYEATGDWLIRLAFR